MSHLPCFIARDKNASEHTGDLRRKKNACCKFKYLLLLHFEEVNIFIKKSGYKNAGLKGYIPAFVWYNRNQHNYVKAVLDRRPMKQCTNNSRFPLYWLLKLNILKLRQLCMSYLDS